MQPRKPSPALVVSIISLVVAMSGTAVAAKVLITSSSQIKNGTIRGADIKKGTITKSKLSKGTLATVTGSSSGASSDARADEAHRQAGPDVPSGGSEQVASLALQPGVYAVLAKTTITPFIKDDGLLETLLRDDKTRAAECNLDVRGTGDFATAPIVGPGSANPATLNLQVTRSLDAPGTATLTCRTAPQVHWQATDTSIIAMRVASSNRTELGR